MIIVFSRTIIVFLCMLLFMRIMGKRQLGQLQLSELIVSILIADLASMPMQDPGIPLLNGLMPIILLFALELLISETSLQSIKFRGFVYGKPTILIKNGKINQQGMTQCRFTIDELIEELRGTGISDIGKVRYSILETDGSLSSVLYASEQPLTPAAMGIEVSEVNHPYIIVDKGRVMSQNLRSYGRDEAWLKKQLKAHGVNSATEVFALIASGDDEIYFQKKEKR